MACEVTSVNPKFGRRSWVKLWVNEWLDGTTRYEMSDAQRAFWIDLLAMAGRSRYPGVICAGKSPDGKYIGYPINKFQSLMSEPLNVEETLAMFERTGKITVESTPDSPLKLLTLELLNWDKYQSEYQRQKPYRKRTKLQKSDTHSYNQGNKTEVEVETEVDVDVEKKNPSPTKTVGVALGSPEFKSFWEAFPKKVDRQEAFHVWVKGLLDGSIKEILLGLEKWKCTEQWTDPEKIPYPSTWLSKKRWKEVPEVPARKESLHEQLEKLGAKP